VSTRIYPAKFRQKWNSYKILRRNLKIFEVLAKVEVKKKNEVRDYLNLEHN
jgi:hypothetical protein